MMVMLWSKAPIKTLNNIKIVCFDIDDTVTTEGKLTAPAFKAMWDLKKHGYYLIPLTGRPASWCDHIARFWPVDAVVGENGAFTFFMMNGRRCRFDTLGHLFLANAQPRLAQVGEKIKKKFPHVQFASDQKYREYDLAIDICEDVPPWGENDIKALMDFCAQEGAHAKLSSIHVNTWFGDYDKALGLRTWLASEYASSILKDRFKWSEFIFIGDSPNDAPLFEAFDYSVAVANIKKFIDTLVAKPTWITDKKSGGGFIEFSKKLCSIK